MNATALRRDTLTHHTRAYRVRLYLYSHVCILSADGDGLARHDYGRSICPSVRASVRVPLRGEKQHAARDIDDRVLGVQPVLQ